MKEDYVVSIHEFDHHMKTVFEPEHFDMDKFVFTENSVIHGLEWISKLSLECEAELREFSPYFSGKFSIIENLRKMQSVASMLSIAIDKYGLKEES